MIQRVVVIAVVLALIFGGGTYAYRQLLPSDDGQARGPSYATVPVERGDIAVGVTTRGILQPAQSGWLYVPWPRVFFGNMPDRFNVVEVLVSEGDYVQQGQPIVQLDAASLQSSIDQARANLEQKRQNLADQLGISVAELGSVNPARGITLRAPIAGRVSLLEVARDGNLTKVGPGVAVQQGMPVARVVQDGRWSMTVHLVPAEAQQVRAGDRVQVRFSGFDGHVEATVMEVNTNPVPMRSSELLRCNSIGGGDEAVDSVVQVYRARVEGDNVGLIMPGMQASLSLPGTDGGTGTPLHYCAAVDGYAHQETLVSTADGVITTVHVADMQEVQAGDPILSLSGQETQRAIEFALEEIRRLEQELQSFETFAQDLLIRAPIEGVVSELQVEPGQTIEMGMSIGSIYNPNQMEIYVQVDDVDVLLVQQGAPVEITLDALPDETFRGEVSWISPSGRDQSGFTFFQVRIQVEGGPELRPGMQAQAFIDAGRAENVLLVPLEAVFQEDRQYKVEVLNEEGVPVVVPVEVGLMNDFLAEIKSGLEEGQQVVVGSSADLLPTRGTPDTILPGMGGGSGGGAGGDAPGDMPGDAVPEPDMPVEPMPMPGEGAG